MSIEDAAEAKALFQSLCLQHSVEEFIRNLSKRELRLLNHWLNAITPLGGIRALILGLVEVEACRRFMEGGDA